MLELSNFNRGFRAASLLILLAFGVASCAEMPKIAGLAPVMPGARVEAPDYRNLAELPQRPTPVDSAKTEETVRSLADERAKTSEEGDRLRNEPFATPEPGMRLKVEE
ncbi:MAG TPA: hypothetical protein VEU06_06215 [Micropepsaceae bacterium]|nr:hypothetical protein [Micropepsaceae bacterium]